MNCSAGYGLVHITVGTFGLLLKKINGTKKKICTSVWWNCWICLTDAAVWGFRRRFAADWAATLWYTGGSHCGRWVQVQGAGSGVDGGLGCEIEKGVGRRALCNITHCLMLSCVVRCVVLVSDSPRHMIGSRSFGWRPKRLNFRRSTNLQRNPLLAMATSTATGPWGRGWGAALIKNESVSDLVWTQPQLCSH